MINDLSVKYNSFILSISYSNYIGTMGGTNKVILAHKEMFESERISHVHIFPRMIKVPRIGVLFNCWGIAIEGYVFEEVYNSKEIIQILNQLTHLSKFKEIHLHHLKNINLRQLQEILDIFDVPMKFYLHDYYTVCLQYNLLMNDKNYCGDGAVSENKCAGCKYYPYSLKLFKIFKSFFKRYQDNIIFIAPSDVAKKVWSSAYPNHADKVKVVFHQELVGYYNDNLEEIPDSKPLKIAYVGSQSINKGWIEWKEAVGKAYKAKCNLDFFYFGNTDESIRYVKEISVVFTSENINAMVDAIRQESIDVVVLWSIWPETYAYTYYESTAANTFVITNKNSGNIAYMVKKRKNGIVLGSGKELEELLCDEARLRTLVNLFKSQNNYGPFNLAENIEIIGLISKDSKKVFIVPERTDNIFFKSKRKIFTIIYILYDLIKRKFKKT